MRVPADPDRLVRLEEYVEALLCLGHASTPDRWLLAVAQMTLAAERLARCRALLTSVTDNLQRRYGTEWVMQKVLNPETGPRDHGIDIA